MFKYCLIIFFLPISLFASVEIDNDFDSVPTGVYSGVTGASFGTNPVLGNATTNTISQEVQALAGIGNGNAFVSTAKFGMRSRNEMGFLTQHSMNAFFKKTASGSVLGGVLAMGFSVPSLSDNVSFGGTTGESGRFLFGLALAGENEVRFSYMGALGMPYTAASPTVLLTDDRWYSLSFNIKTDSGGWLVTDAVLQDYGNSGLVPGSVLLSMPSELITPPFGSALISAGSGYAVVVADGSAGAATMDNISVVPEPSAAILLAAFLSVSLAWRFRQQSGLKV